MAGRRVHYESAFEDYLRGRGIPYVSVDERKKAIFSSVAIKSFDFLVYSSSGPNLLVDVKGRKFPDITVKGKKRGHGKVWENWITRDDVEGLGRWEKVFGKDFVATLVFAYWLQGAPQRCPFADVHLYRGKHYAFVGVSLSDYVTGAKPRCEKWQTISVPSAKFAKLSRDIATFL